MSDKYARSKVFDFIFNLACICLFTFILGIFSKKKKIFSELRVQELGPINLDFSVFERVSQFID